MELSSVNNEKVKYWQKLKQKKYRDNEKLFLVEDYHLVNEALNIGIVKEIITIDKNAKFNVPTYYVTDKIMKVLSDQITSSKIIAICHMFEEKEIKGNIIVLDRLQDPGNLGTIIRGAEGMIFHINIIKRDIDNFLDTLDKKYLKIATSVDNGLNIKDLNFTNCAIVIGNEGSGIRKEIKDKCDKNVYIKMNSNCESLNAGVCASILMYEVNHE